MSDRLKITFLSIRACSNDDWTDRGEIYWHFMVDGEPVGGDGSVSRLHPRRVTAGSTTTLTNAQRVLCKLPGQQLIVEACIGEKDKLDHRQAASFRDTHVKTSNWGIGRHTRSLRDGNLKVLVRYRIERDRP